MYTEHQILTGIFEWLFLFTIIILTILGYLAKIIQISIFKNKIKKYNKQK